jgi:hypothetical protein
MLHLQENPEKSQAFFTERLILSVVRFHSRVDNIAPAASWRTTGEPRPAAGQHDLRTAGTGDRGRVVAKRSAC